MPLSTPVEKKPHHHGNLREALIDAGIELLEAGEPFSLRATARRVGVSQAAPYRHFVDKESLEAAMATRGFMSLQRLLERVVGERGPAVRLVDLAVVYTCYAADNPALYGLMFSHSCAKGDQRLAAAADVFALLVRTAKNIAPHTSDHDLATAGWALAHGLASLYLDGKLDVEASGGLETRVRAAFDAIGA